MLIQIRLFIYLFIYCIQLSFFHLIFKPQMKLIQFNKSVARGPFY